MSNKVFFRGLMFGMAAATLTVALPAHAINKCKVKVDKTGVITVDASGVSGTLLWGSEAGAENAAFFNAGTCVTGAKAKRCQLADPGTLDARTPPAGCTIYLNDDAAPCSAWIRGCTPGPRESGQASAFADFFALMPADNAATVAPGAAVHFPQDGPATGSIVRSGPSTFVLAEVGTYEVQFTVSVSEPGQLVLALDDGMGFAEDPATVVGRATGTSQIAGVSLVTTTAANTLLQVRNPSGGFSPRTITPRAGGISPASAHLVIKKL
jgi:hypothetical protein